MLNKKAQGLSTSAIVLIILGVLLLAVLVAGFAFGWKNFSLWIPKDNVDEIVSACNVACSTHSVYDFCEKMRTLRAEDLPGGEKEVTNTCFFFSTNSDYSKYGFSECNSIECP